MKKIVLRTVTLSEDAGPRAGQVLHYATMMREMLFSAPMGQSISTDAGIRGADIGRIIRRANEDRRDFVLLEDADHEFLRGRLDSFQWQFFTFEIADFCIAIREAPSVDPNATVPSELATAAPADPDPAPGG